MRILVTGGSGFLGTAICSRLRSDDHEVVPYDRRSSKDHDILNPGALRRAMSGCGAAIHLAGVLGTDELFDQVHLAVDVNVQGTVNVLDACVEAGARYVGITMLPVFPSIYTATKVCAERLAGAYHAAHGLPVSHVRAFNAFGAGQAHGPGHPRKIVPALSVEGWSGVPLRVWGDGTQGVDLIHADQIADVFADAVRDERGGSNTTYDAGTGRGWSVNEVARWILGITASGAGIEHVPMRRGEIPQQVVAEGLGWDRLRQIPRFDMERLVETVMSYREHPAVREALAAGATR